MFTLQNGGLVLEVMMMKYRGVSRRWEIECIEPGMEEIRQIMLPGNGQPAKRATQFDGKYKPDSAGKTSLLSAVEKLLVLYYQIIIYNLRKLSQ